MNGTHYGSQSMVAPLRRVIVRRPDWAFGRADPARWHYGSRPDLNEALREHEALVKLLVDAGAEVIDHDEPLADRADAVFVHDPCLVTDRGGILLRMGKALRRGEEAAIGRCLERHGVPVSYRLHSDATAEGGDCLWLDAQTLAVGVGFRTNQAGVRQLREALWGQGVEILAVQLPFQGGPEACLHLMSLISVLDSDLAVVYEPLLPVPFWQFLRERGFELIPVPDEEFATMGPNVLALAPRYCVMLEGNPVTRSRLEAVGCHVVTYKGDELSRKAEGGATCLTRPVWRA